MFGFCSDFSEGKDTLSFTLSLAVYRHGYEPVRKGFEPSVHNQRVSLTIYLGKSHMHKHPQTKMCTCELYIPIAPMLPYAIVCGHET